MFRKNTTHRQPALISAVSELTEKQRARLQNSWAATFYKEFFSRIDEEAFAVLYSNTASRPNVPVNILVGLEALKSGFGWSDAELYDAYCFNLQVRYALGCDQWGNDDFEIRTLYYFRERLSRYNAEHGINLLEQAFEQITDAQITTLKVRTGMQRMDSTQIASNIVSASRLQLLVEGVQRVERILNESDRARLSEQFSPYVRDSAGHYTYRVKGKEALQEHLTRLGESIYALLQELRPTYAAESAFQVLERLFTENFNLVESQTCPKSNEEISSGCLQSVDDLEATYRTKGNAHYKGYVANLTETCDPENEIQLITKVQVAANNEDDSQLLAEALPNLKERTDLETLVTDGGYGGETSDAALQTAQVRLIQTAIRGRSPSTDKVHLAAFDIQFDGEGNPTEITCPQGQTTPIDTSARQKAFVAHFDPAICQTCPLLERCPAQPGKRDTRQHLRFTQTAARSAKRRRTSHEHTQVRHNLRSAVESSVRSLKHPFPAGKLPVRGKFRMTCMIIGSAAMTNVRRIYRHIAAKIKVGQIILNEKKRSATIKTSFFAILQSFRAGYPSLAPRFDAVWVVKFRLFAVESYVCHF
jgi:hypothetical protein